VELIEGLVAADKPALAIGVKALLSKMFNFAISRGLLEANPVAGIGRIAEVRPRERVLSDDEIRLAWEAFGMPPFSRPVGLALRLALLTGARAGEVAGLTIGELEALDDPEEALWRLPGARAKNRRRTTVNTSCPSPPSRLPPCARRSFSVETRRAARWRCLRPRGPMRPLPKLMPKPAGPRRTLTSWPSPCAASAKR